MKTYGWVNNGLIQQIIPPVVYDAEDPRWQEGDPSRIGQEIPIELRYHPSMVENMHDITDIDPHPQEGWVASEAGGVWTFAPYTPTPQQILSSQSAKLQALTQLASSQKTALANRISTLNDAIELEMATTEEVAELPARQAQLLEWKRYAVYLGRVTGQDGWPPEVEWPVQPLTGMDLTVSAVSPGDQPS